VQTGVFLCSARNNLLCDMLQGLECVAACMQVGCFAVLHQRKFFSADSLDGRKVNSSWCFCTTVWPSTWGGIGSMCKKAVAQFSVFGEAANTKSKWKMIEFSM